MGVITDVHSVPVPIETQYVRTNSLSAHQVWVWMGVTAARDTSDERPPLFYHF